MRELLNKLRRVWLIVKNRLWRTPVPFKTVYLDELPDKFENNAIYLIGENSFLWSAALLCPCGCGSVIQLNLLSDSEPCWRVEEHFDSTVSISPSVWSRKGCGSHYFIKRRKIKWYLENN